MRAISLRVTGELWTDHGRGVLLLRATDTPEDASQLVTLYCGLVIRGPEDHVFPALLLDDWGNEIRGRKLYRWLREHGDQFPRAEVFGFERNGEESQLFVRALELYVRYPLYGVVGESGSVADGVPISAVLLPDPTIDTPTPLKKPTSEEVGFPLRQTMVKWWRVSAEMDVSQWQAFNSTG